MIVVFVISLLFFAFVGLYSSKHKEANTEDYLLAGKAVKPWLVALSAVSTNNSGYMFIGMIGFTYSAGLSSIWLMIGWILGDLIGSLMVAKKLRQLSGRENIMSFGTLLGHRGKKTIKAIRVLSGLLSLFFLSSYAAAQFKAGGKALMVTFEWPLYIGVIGGAILVVLYCFSGGIRASIWTDAAQSIVMIFAMGLLMFYAVDSAGGWSATISKLNNVSDNYMNWFPELPSVLSWSGIPLFVLGWMFAGFGVIGQPHIMVRYMTMDSADNIKKVRKYYYSWFTAFYMMAVMVGLLARIVLVTDSKFDPELALPTMSMELLPDYFVGIMLAGIFAATISTADSLVISCTSAVTNDLFPRLKHHYKATKAVTLSIAFLAVLFALSGQRSVFELVVYTWAVLGTAFGPLLTMIVFGKSPGEVRSLITMVVGVGVTLLWDYLSYDKYVYSMLPGMVAGFLAYFITGFLDKPKS